MPEFGWILRGKTPVRAQSHEEWTAFFHDMTKRTVRKTQLSPSLEVSTVFLGIDHSFGRGAPPVLFETMVFNDGEENGMERCSTWDEAVAMHERWVTDTRQRYNIPKPDPTTLGGSTIPLYNVKRIQFKDTRPTAWQHLLDDEDD